MAPFRLPESKIPLFKDLCYSLIDNADPQGLSVLRGLSLLNPMSRALGHSDFNALQLDAKCYGEGILNWEDLYDRLLKNGANELEILPSIYGPALSKASKSIKEHYEDVVTLWEIDYQISYAREELSSPTPPAGLFSCDGPTLRAIQRKALSESKTSGYKYHDVLRLRVQNEGFDDWTLAFRAMFLPVQDNEVHRVFADDTVLTLRVEGTSLYLDGYSVPDKAARSLGSGKGQVVYGHVTKLALANGSHTNINQRPLKPGWWLCKYDQGQPRINLTSFSTEQVRWIGDFFRFGGQYSYLSEARVFQSVIKWASQHPRIASKGSDSYFPNWGPDALNAMAAHNVNMELRNEESLSLKP